VVPGISHGGGVGSQSKRFAQLKPDYFPLFFENNYFKNLSM
jgi:hypothetical protein